MAKTRAARVVQFGEIEQRFHLVPMTFGKVHPAVGKDDRDGSYSIRVLVSSSFTAGFGGGRTEKYDYFYLDAEGAITAAPRGYARDYRPGRIPVEELDAAVAKYAEAVR